MITAKEARKNADKHALIGLDEILEVIEQKSNLGQFALVWYKHINSDVRDKLMELGFKLRHFESTYQKDPSYWTISW